MVVLELPPAPEPPKPNATAPIVLWELMVGRELAVTAMSPAPPAVTSACSMNAETSLPIVLSTRATPTARLIRPALRATDTISAATFEVSLAATSTPPAELTSPESSIQAETALVSVLREVVTAPAAEPPMEMPNAALAAAVRDSMVAVSSAVTRMPPTVVVSRSALRMPASTVLSISLVAIATPTDTDAPATPNEAATDAAPVSALMIEVSSAFTLRLATVIPRSPSPAI